MSSTCPIAPLAFVTPQPAAMSFVQDRADRTTNVAQETFSLNDAAFLLREIGLRQEMSRILEQSNESQSKLVQEVMGVQKELSKARLGENQKEAENKKLREENEALKKTLGEFDKAQKKLIELWHRAQKEIETLTVKNQEIAQLKKENEELKDSLEMYQDVAMTEKEANLIENFEKEENQALEKNTPKHMSQ